MLDNLDQMQTDFLQERLQAFRSMDLQVVRDYCIKWGVRVIKDDRVLELMIHKTRTAIPQLQAYERAASRRWLQAHGSVGLFTGDIEVPASQAELFFALCESLGVPFLKDNPQGGKRC